LTGGSIGYVHHGGGTWVRNGCYWTQFNTGFMGLTAKSECLFRMGLNFEQKYTALTFAPK
jgi:hypothetical protein